jgi:UDP-N-acetylglucosamine 2-epimerase (non-hydrolysing)
MKVINVVGARPNFMKIAPIVEAMNGHPEKIQHLLVHTGQHYDKHMSQTFFDDLGISAPDVNLGVGPGSHAEQTARIMVAFEKVCLKEKPDLVVVVGDVNSTMACTITAKKLGIEAAHVEAGLRSRDMSMPEEINRLCTDVLCDYLFVTDHFAIENLVSEGVKKDRIFFVGNVMIDTLLRFKEKAEQLNMPQKFELIPKQYATITLHRPSNVDDPEILEWILDAFSQIAYEVPLILPLHPRTKKNVEMFGLWHYFSTTNEKGRICVKEPMGYLEFLSLNMHAKMVMTDSGGLQEETTILGVPCLTIRSNTERPITCEVGTNQMVGNDPKKIIEAAGRVLSGNHAKGGIPEKWDGKASQRIVEHLLKNRKKMLNKKS